MISLNHGSSVAKVLIVSVLIRVWLFKKRYTRELVIRNIAQAFFSNEWLMLNGTEGKTGKDSTNITTDESFLHWSGSTNQPSPVTGRRRLIPGNSLLADLFISNGRHRVHSNYLRM